MPVPSRALASTVGLAVTALLVTSCATDASSPSSSSGDGGGKQTVTFMGFFGTFQDAFTKTVIDPSRRPTRTSRSTTSPSRVRPRSWPSCARARTTRRPTSP
ncbi:hypothetical protein NKH77_48905 [Streptomyces sp. M19]